MHRFAVRITPDDLGAIARWFYVKMLKAGYTSICEFHYVHHAPDGAPYGHRAELAQRVVQAAADTGIGMTMLPVLYQYSGFGAQAPRGNQRRFINTPDALLRIVDDLRRAQLERGDLRYGGAPHSLRAVSEASLRTLLKGLDALAPDAPVHIHIAEQTAEVDACMEAEGARLVRWLLDRFDVDARWCLVHATHTDAGETTALARSGAVAGLCLMTEANLGDGVFPAHDYLDANGAFGVGSDSHIGVDWRAELRLLEYGQRFARPERNVLGRAGRRCARHRARGRPARSGHARTGSCSMPIIRTSRSKRRVHGSRRSCSLSTAARRSTISTRADDASSSKAVIAMKHACTRTIARCCRACSRIRERIQGPHP